jgi:hypothetical protein
MPSNQMFTVAMSVNMKAFLKNMFNEPFLGKQNIKGKGKK